MTPAPASGPPAGLDWLAQRARSSPAHVALSRAGRQWTYAALDHWAGQLAGSLRAVGLEAGQHVAVLLPNGPEYIALLHALIRLGALLVPLDPRLSASELRWQLEDSNAGWLLCDNPAAAPSGPWRILALTDLPSATPIASRSLDPDAPFAILYTSGTSGRPKGVVQTLANHFWSALASALRLGVLPGDRWLLNIPLCHVGGLAIPLRCCLYGITVVLPAESGHFDADQALAEIETQNVTLLSLVPTMLQRLLDTGREFPASLRLILLGGAAAPEALLRQALAQRLPVACTYGLTETASQIATSLPAGTARKPGSAGRPLPFSRIRILGPDDRELAAGEIGEIVITGPTLMQGYYHREPLRGAAFHTGDLGYLDGDGDLWIVQRRSDLIVSGGENVYPAEVERVLLEHPAVREACVVGVADREWGQKVAAALVLHPDRTLAEDELREFCRQNLAGYKLPRLIRLLPELPHTASGKIRRDEVRKLWS